jgi:hypothetical protein
VPECTYKGKDIKMAEISRGADEGYPADRPSSRSDRHRGRVKGL